MSPLGSWHRDGRWACPLFAVQNCTGRSGGVLLGQSPWCAAAHLAIWKIGAISVPLFKLFQHDALASRIGDAGVTLGSDGRRGSGAAWRSGGWRCGPRGRFGGRICAFAQTTTGHASDPDLHIGHHRQAQRRAAWSPCVDRSFARCLGEPRSSGPDRRLPVDACRLGLDWRIV